MIEKIRKAVTQPYLIKPYLMRESRKLYRDLYWRWKRILSDSDTYQLSLDGYDLLVDFGDKGLSKDLAIDGVREPVSSTAYRNQLQKLGEESSESVTVLEIGGNIGYYALMPAADIENVKIYVVEADPTNVSLLKKNIQLNDYEEKFEVECIAFGEENGTQEIHLSHHSNFHSLQDKLRDDYPERVNASKTINVQRGEDWLEERNIDQHQIDVLRMDVEGYEAKILRGLPDILVNGLLLHIELHPKLMDQKDVNYLRNQLQDLTIIEAARNHERIDGIQDIDDALSYPWIEITGRLEKYSE